MNEDRGGDVTNMGEKNDAFFGTFVVITSVRLNVICVE